MSKHTPGPWFAQDTRLVGGQVAVVGPNHDRKAGEQGEMVVAHVNGRSGEQGANARLIAAAPDLLAALQAACDTIDLEAAIYSARAKVEHETANTRSAGNLKAKVNFFRATIAKATGGDL